VQIPTFKKMCQDLKLQIRRLSRSYQCSREPGVVQFPSTREAEGREFKAKLGYNWMQGQHGQQSNSLPHAPRKKTPGPQGLSRPAQRCARPTSAPPRGWKDTHPPGAACATELQGCGAHSREPRGWDPAAGHNGGPLVPRALARTCV
jgi:hypothetical protein